GAQDKDGGWGDLPDSTSNADGPGAVMQAMPDASVAKEGLSYLRKHQLENGGFRAGHNGAVNSQSTAWAAEGMMAVDGASGAVDAALGYIASQQDADGHYRYSGSNDKTPVWVTGEVLIAASGENLPVTVPPRSQQPPPPEKSATPPSSSPLTIPTPGGSPSVNASPATPSGGGGGVGAGSIAGGAGH